MAQQIDRLNSLRAAAQAGSAYRRAVNLLDEASFVQLASFSSTGAGDLGAGVATGFGTINGRPVHIFVQEGAVGRTHADKITRLIDAAVDCRTPVIAIIDAKGVKLDEGAEALEAFSRIISKLNRASEAVTTAAIALNSTGAAAIEAASCDFTIAVDGSTELYMTPAAVLESMGQKDAARLSAQVQAQAGTVAFVCRDEQHAADTLRELLAFLPDYIGQEYENDISDDPNRIIPELDSGSADMDTLARLIADDNYLLELNAGFTPGVLTAFTRIFGYNIGLLAYRGGARLTAAEADKCAAFINTCQAFDMPLVHLIDCEGFAADLQQEKQGLTLGAASLARALSQFENASVAVITGKAIGSAYIALAAKALGYSAVYAWPQAQVLALPALSEAALEGAEAERREARAEAIARDSVFDAAASGLIDEIILPSETRKYIAAALEMAVDRSQVETL